MSQTKIRDSSNNIVESDIHPAHAPYNFVPLNLSVVDSDPIVSQDRYHSERFTGHIDCKLETLTPIFIRGCLTEDEVKRGIEAKKKSDFFSPASKVRIPGSSIRGMVRSLVEVVSWSRFGFFDDKNLYYRSFADKSSVGGEYKNNINPNDEKTGKSNYKMSAGYLVKDGFRYIIYPSEGKQFEQIGTSEAKELVKNNGQVYSEFNYFRLHDGRFIIVSGSMPRKRDWRINKIEKTLEKGIEIPEIDIKNYEMDENRGKNLAKGKKVPNLLESCKKDPEVPCFYITWTDQKGNFRVSFGHTGLFRIAYKKSIGEHLPPIHHSNKIDFAHAIFGDTTKDENGSFAGRVFFEDAQLVNQNETIFLGEKIPKLLLGPNPTTFQHYLKQDSTNIKKLKHYNSETSIRGNKFYWHKSGTKWEKENQNEFKEKIETKINPLKPKKTFEFRIRYENLTLNELGALLFVLKLPVGCAHKIGMGKPLGLGTVVIEPTLYITDRKMRYSTLFDISKSEWVIAENKNNDENVEKYKTAFEEHILRNMNSKERGTATSLWDTYRLRQLKTMLDVKKGIKLEEEGTKIEYMALKDFKDRNVLPIPEKV
ncbi:MAG: TIGR03986 family CRISPR-associated RAMP protein [Candidatus Methanoperedenaceae archaeon]|nr:TIGR03986 family CRISPR-associated RAMP protein [Candidatus Methanoperedenaceae archaeon]